MTWLFLFLLLLAAITYFFSMRNSSPSSHSRKPVISPRKDFALETSEELSEFISGNDISTDENAGFAQVPPSYYEAERSIRPPISADTPRLSNSLLHALARSPKSMYAYWDIDSSQYALDDFYQKHPSGSKLVMRVNELADSNICNSFDIQIEPHYRNMYIHVPYANVSYSLQLGVLTPGGAFHCWLSSRDILMPRENISPVIDPEWAPVYGIHYRSDLFGRIDLDSGNLVKNSNQQH